MTGIAGAVAVIHYARLGLTLAHYDARAHLVVARRIVDSMTPGWQQIGAIWLPLPHVINMLPVQVDAWYRNGASGIVISVASMSLASGALASVLLRVSHSLTAALMGAALMILNPNVLYLQSTPMTEPLLFGLVMLGVATTAHWLDEFPNRSPWPAGAVLAAACLTRYEAWPVTASVVFIAAAVLLRRGHWTWATVRGITALALWPAVAIVAFSLNSRWVVGAWFVTGGFFVPDNVDAIGNPWEAWTQIDKGLKDLSGPVLVRSGYLGAVLIALAATLSKEKATLALLAAPAAAAALPMFAYVEGHPFRIRYELPLVISAAALAAGGVSLLPRRLQPVVALPLILLTVHQASPLDREAPLLRESKREAAAMHGRRAVTQYLSDHHDGSTIMMSMGSLAHYMHDLSAIGLGLKDFLHEGNGKPWEFAMLSPARRVRWIVIEEQAEGGDTLFHAAKRPRWLDGFERVAHGGGVTLYRAKQ